MGIKQFFVQWIFPPGFTKLLRGRKKLTVQTELDPQSIQEIKKTCRLRDRHIGKRCFILGSGSSVKLQDIKKLSGEIVMSVSNSFVHPDFQFIKPMYHILPPVFRSHSHLYEKSKFVEWLKEMDSKIFDAEIILHIFDKQIVDENSIFKNRKMHWIEYTHWNEDFNTPIDPRSIPHIWSVSEAAITMAVYMGFEKIYLLGFDHDWFNGPLNYFYDEKKEHRVQPTKEALRFADSEFQMRRHASIFKKYKYLYSLRQNIFNANAERNSYVDVFPKVEYDSLFT